MAKFSKKHLRCLKNWPEAASQKPLDAEDSGGFTLLGEWSFPETPWLGSAKQPGSTCPWPATAAHHVLNGPVVIQGLLEYKVVWEHFKELQGLACSEVL